MDTTERLASAWAAVESSGVPEHLHEVAFKAALSLEGALSNGQSLPSVTPLPASRTAQSVVDTAGDELVTTTAADLFYKFAHETGIDQESLEEVFYFHEGHPGLNVPAGG